MFVREEWPIRGCRPGRYGLPEEDSEETQIIRMANVEIYAKRAEARLPIFRDVRDSAIGGDNRSSAR